MKYRSVDLRCPTRACGLRIAFKVAVPADHPDLATTVQREWTDCPKCSERKMLACLAPAVRGDGLFDPDPLVTQQM